MHEWDKLEKKYWRQEDSWRFEFFPFEGKVVCFTDGGLLKTIHHFGTCKLDIDWNSFEGRTFYIKTPASVTNKELLKRVASSVKGLMSQKTLATEELLSNNVDNRTGKPLCIFQIRKYISTLKKDVLNKKRSREDICKFFNQYNIEEDDERIRLGVGVMRVIRSKPAKTMLEEGKGILERMFKKGKLVKITKEEYKRKMETYGNKE